MKTINREWSMGRLMLSAVGGMTLFTCNLVDAGPARPGWLELEQPSGQILRGRQVGDEWCNRVELASGFTVARDGRGMWRYVLDSQGSLGGPAQESPPVGLARGVGVGCEGRQPTHWFQRPGFATGDAIERASTSSEIPILFILAEFSDRKGTYSEQDFSAFIDQELSTYYHTVSYGGTALIPATESFGTTDNGVIGWLNLGTPHPNTGDTLVAANQELAWQAIQAADRYIDYSSYDQDLDGYVDANELAVVVIAAGYEASYGWPTPSLWAHAWNLDDLGTLAVDGVLVGAYHGNRGGYAQFGEIHRANRRDKGHQATMGVMAHELGHLIYRLPDLYDTDTSSNGAGAWCLMSYGSWGWSMDDTYSGETPVMPSAYIRDRLGWSVGKGESGQQTLTATGHPSANSGDTLLKVPTTSTFQWFLVENRQPQGYDRGLEKLLGTSQFGGLAIWHVDEHYSTNRWDKSRLADIEEADGGTTAYATPNLWAADSAPASFDDTSTPSAKLNGGKGSGIALSDVSTSGTQMSVKVVHP